MNYGYKDLFSILAKTFKIYKLNSKSSFSLSLINIFLYFSRGKVWLFDFMNTRDSYRCSCIFIDLPRYRCIGRWPTCQWQSSSVMALWLHSMHFTRLHSLAPLQITGKYVGEFYTETHRQYVSFPWSAESLFAWENAWWTLPATESLVSIRECSMDASGPIPLSCVPDILCVVLKLTLVPFQVLLR